MPQGAATVDTPSLSASGAGDEWTIPSKARTEDEVAAADTFTLITVGGRPLPAPDTISLGDVNCAGLLVSARYILDGNRQYSWGYAHDRGTPSDPRCVGGMLEEEGDGGYRLAGDSIEFLRFDDGEGHRQAIGRIVRDTLEVRRGSRLERYVRGGTRGPG